MPHPAIENRTGFAYTTLYAADEEGRPLAVPLLRATLEIDKAGGPLRVAEKQIESLPAGEFWFDKDDSSYKYEPEVAFVKVATDVVLLGHAQATAPNISMLDVGLKVGPVQKVARVFGDRYWVKQGGTIVATRPLPFERMPLVYERAFGGWDRAHVDQSHWRFDSRNPVGRGFGDPLRYVEEGKVPLPNVESPTEPLRRYGDAPVPVGFGFTSPHWQSRAQFAGTYDEAWAKERKPLLPKDFDRRFFNAASPGLIAAGYLTGGEDVVVVNASPVPQLRFKLPGLPPPVSEIELRGGTSVRLAMNLDTVVVDTDAMLVILIWRAYTAVPSGPHDVMAVAVSQERVQ